MSRLDKLIKELCPNGVDYYPLWKLTAWDKRFQGVDKEKQSKIINYPVLLANDLFSLVQDSGDVFLLSTGSETGWTTADMAGDNVCEGEVVSIPWGKAGTVNVKNVIKYYKGKFVTGDNRIMTSLDTDFLDNRYLYYIIVSSNGIDNSFYRGSGIRHPDMRKVLDLRIPVPPLEVQREIVRVLDKFTLLTAELTAELTARTKQYEFYRDYLLTFEEKNETILNRTEQNRTEQNRTEQNRTEQNRTEQNNLIRKLQKEYGYIFVQLSNVVLNKCSGATPKKGNAEYYDNGEIPWIRTQDVKFNEIYSVDGYITEKAVKETSVKWIPENCVIVAISGATAGRCAVNKIKATTNQHCLNLEIDPDIAYYKYIYYCVSKCYNELISKKQGARGDLNSSLVMDIKIPLPSLSRQYMIANILDQFDSLCNGFNDGIPAEIKARQKQYEYYRDKLLSFKELEA